MLLAVYCLTETHNNGWQFGRHLEPVEVRARAMNWRMSNGLQKLSVVACCVCVSDTEGRNLRWITPAGYETLGYFDDLSAMVLPEDIRVKDILRGDQESLESLLSDKVPIRLMFRRYPSAWWGHFYRAEVWASLVLLIVIVSRAIKARKRNPK